MIWAAVTTAVAFGSFAVSPVAPIRALGLWLAAGLARMLVAAFGLYPALLRIAAAGGRGFDRAMSRRAPGLVYWIVRRRALVLAVFAAAAAVAALGASQLRTDSNVLDCFAVDHPARRAVAGLEAADLAGAAAELVVRLPAATAPEGRFRDPAGLDRLAALGADVRALPGVRGALGAGDPYRAAIADVVVGDEPTARARWLVLGFMQADEDAARRLDALLADDGRAARLSVLVPLRGPRGLDPVLAAVRRTAAVAFPEAEVSIEGELPFLLATQRHLLRTLGVSLALRWLRSP